MTDPHDRASYGRYRRSVRRVLLVVVGIVLITVGAGLATVALGGRGAVAVQGSVICAKEGLRVLTPRVAAQGDGLRLKVANVGHDRRYEVVSSGAPDAPAIAGMLPEDGTIELRLALAPGEITFACLRAGTGERMEARFDLRDPGDLWTSDSLACADPESGVFETDHREEPFEDTARRALPGLLPLDLLVVPGYPRTAWHGELHVVIRDEEVVGRVVRALNHGTWNVAVDACSWTGLTEGAAAETGAT